MSLRTRDAAKIIVLSLLATPAHASDVVSLFGAGNAYCSDYNEGRKRNVENWVLGFVSGAAVFTGDDHLDGKSAKDVLLWFATYCKDHPHDLIKKAASQAFKTGLGEK